MDEWYCRLPLAARVAITAVLTIGVLIPMYLWLMSDVLAPPYSVGMAFFVGLVIGFSVIVGDRDIDRRFGSVERYIVFRRALRKGEPPADIAQVDLSAWLAWSRSKVKIGWALAVAFGVFALLSMPLLFALIAAVFLAQGIVQHRRIARLERHLGQRDLAGSAG